MSQKLLSIGAYGLHVIKYPSGRYGFVGCVPEILCDEKKDKNGLPITPSKVFDTENEAIEYFESKKHLF